MTYYLQITITFENSYMTLSVTVMQFATIYGHEKR